MLDAAQAGGVTARDEPKRGWVDGLLAYGPDKDVLAMMTVAGMRPEHLLRIVR